MARTIINNPALPRSNSPHSNAVKVGGLIFVSGFPGYDAEVQVPKGDFAQQMRLALQHIKATLEYAGSSIDKIAKVRAMIDARSRPVALQVDGGINAETAPLALNAGADVLVAGSAVFTGGAGRYAQNIADLRAREHATGRLAAVVP